MIIVLIFKIFVYSSTSLVLICMRKLLYNLRNKLILINSKLIKDNKSNLENLIKEIAKSFRYEIHDINLLTNHNPMTIQIILKNLDGKDITLDDCSRFNEPVLSAIDSSNLLNCRYVLEISSQGVSDELTSNRDFKTFKGFPVRVELKQNNSKIKNLNGLLYEKSNDYLAINIKGKIKKVPLNEVIKVSLATIED